MRLLLFCLVHILICTSYTFGQLKKIDFSSKSTTASNSYIVSKKKNQNTNKRISGNWNPNSINFHNQKVNLTVFSDDQNQPILIEGRIPTILRDNNLHETAKSYLEKVQELYSSKVNVNISWEITTIQKDEHNKEVHVKCQQLYKDIPIYGAEVIIHGDDNGFYMMNGRFSRPESNKSITNHMSKFEALQIVTDDLGEIQKNTIDQFNIFDAIKNSQELIWLDMKGQLQLAFHISQYKNLAQRWEYFIDANSGEILNNHLSICKFHHHNHEKCRHWLEEMPPIVSTSKDLFGNNQQINGYQSGQNYFMIDASREEMFDEVNSSMPNDPIGTIWTLDAFDTSPESNEFSYDHIRSSEQNFPNKEEGVSAYINGSKSYEYFKNTHNRISINGQGGNIISLVNVSEDDGSGMDNAFWNGVAIFYGNGSQSFRPLPRGLDVAGHELSHGVIQSTANLQYQGESGALNESMADIFGVMIDRDDWLVGEDVVLSSSFPSGALRSLQDPHNGAATNDFGRGWQPKHYSERYQGTEDNGGVHINSGIPNHAFYLFATHPEVGKSKAEKVYYRALTTYMTKSSKFIDARVATLKAAADLYGNEVISALEEAWDNVGVLGGTGGNYEVDIEINPGQDLIIFTAINSSGEESNLFVVRSDGQLVFNPATEKDPKSKPSVTDDGSEVIFVTNDGELGYLYFNWETNTIDRDLIFESSGGWRNAVFSKDGLRMAALRNTEEPIIFVYDFVSQSGVNYTLSNPTFSQDGTRTGDVKYADALEFDYTGEYVMYDAFNVLESIFNENIEYWDIGFIKVWNNHNNTFEQPDQIQKLFSGLPEGVSVGNPTFAKNSPFIIAYDELIDNEFAIKGANIESNQIGTIFSGNVGAGYPSYSSQDNIVIFDAQDQNEKDVIGGISLAENKIESVGQATILLSYDQGIRWATWFANGKRQTTNDADVSASSQTYAIFPNPSTGIINITFSLKQEYSVKLTNLMGQTLKQGVNLEQIDMTNYSTGQYLLQIYSADNVYSKVLTKI